MDEPQQHDSGPPSAEVVAALISDFAPEFARQPVVASATSGSSNWVFRLGEDHAVRLPRDDSYVDDLLKEARWLPALGPLLDISVPEVGYVGEPSRVFSRPWTIVTWVPGELPIDQTPDEQLRLARSLAHFTQRLHRVDTFGQPGGADRWGYRAGEPVTDRIDAWAEQAAHDLADLFDPAAVREAWRRVRDVPPASDQPCWVHTDLSSENLLVGPDGSLCGVIDFGGLAIGEPSVDLLYAWSLFDQPALDVFRAEAAVDDATWLRARAWAFVGPGLLTLVHYRHAMPRRAANLTTMVMRIAAEVGITLR